MRKKLCFLLAFLCIFSAFPVKTAGAVAEMPSVSGADAVYMLHIESGRVVCKKNEDERLPAGACVKMLSGLVACERLKNFLSDKVTIGNEMIASSSGKKYGIAGGDSYSWREMLLLALTGSYNDAYDVIAYSVGNGEKVGQANYVNLLNERAKEIGATSTYIGDASGVADNSYTTAGDLALIAQVAIQNSLYMGFVGMKSGELDDGEIVRSRNSLITGASFGSAECLGLCVGETNHAGTTLVTVAKKGNDTYLLILLGTKDASGNASETATNNLAVKLVKWAYANYTNLEIVSPDTEICTIPVTVSDTVDEVAAVASESMFAYLPSGAEVGREITLSIRLSVEELEAPVTEGTQVGFVVAIYEGNIIGSVPLVTAESAERSGFMSRLLSIKNLTKNRKTRAGIVFFLLTMTVWIGGELIYRNRRKNKWKNYYRSKSKWK